MADANNHLTYANDSALASFESMKPSLQASRPLFGDKPLIGLSLTQLHPEPERLTDQLDILENSLSEELEVGDVVLKEVITPITSDSANTNFGVIVEWEDITPQRDNDQKIREQAAVEREKLTQLRTPLDEHLATVGQVNCIQTTIADAVKSK